MAPEDPPTRLPSQYNTRPTYLLPKASNRHYQQQYADMYFARLAQLKPAVEQMAADAWGDFSIADEKVRRVDRVLDVRQGELCWVVGTVYMEMPLKPNVLEDIGKEHWISAPPPRVKYDNWEMEAGEGAKGAHSQAQGSLGTQIMLEDESGRLRLTGTSLSGCLLVTGAIVAVIGTENKDGDFEVLDLRVPDLPRQPERWEYEDGLAAVKGGKASSNQGRKGGGKVAIISGLGITGDTAADTLTLDLLLEFLLGESTTSPESASQITRLIIAGNSLSHASPIPSREEAALAKKAAALGSSAAKKYGYDSSSYNSAPTDHLDAWLADLLPSIPVTIVPGDQDPTSASLPQQPLHAALFPRSRAYMAPPPTSSTTTKTQSEPGWLDAQTNPTQFSLAGHLYLGTAGQPVDDIAKYLPFSEASSTGSSFTLSIMEAMLRWRLVAPTAPDTLWCYPFQDGDQFVLQECPHVFFVGNQDKFETTVIEGPTGQHVRLVSVPRFRDRGEVVIVDEETLECEVLRFQLFRAGGGV
jgi:DNA polymerase delta subunit 2